MAAQRRRLILSHPQKGEKKSARSASVFSKYMPFLCTPFGVLCLDGALDGIGYAAKRHTCNTREAGQNNKQHATLTHQRKKKCNAMRCYAREVEKRRTFRV